MLSITNNFVNPTLYRKQDSAPKSFINFKGVTDVFCKNFINTQAEMIREFAKDPAARGIVGGLPPYWLAKLDGRNDKKEVVKKVLQLFRAAIKHLKPYNAQVNRKGYRADKAGLEIHRMKEASAFLTKGLRHFGILSETNSVHLKRLKVRGNYISRGYVLREKGEDPTLEKLFIKKFRKINPYENAANHNGKYAEIAHGLFINSNIRNKHISKFYWGDIEAGYLTTEYQVPPKGVSPVVKLKSVYEDISEFATDFYNQTGISLKELNAHGINVGGLNKDGKFVPQSKYDIIMPYLQSVLAEAGLTHCDLHANNAVIGSTRQKQPILRLIDIGGVIKEIAPQRRTPRKKYTSSSS